MLNNMSNKRHCIADLAEQNSLFATTFILSFVKYSTKTYDAFATSAFKTHSALSTANVVYTIISLVTYPIMAKLSNVREGTYSVNLAHQY